MYLVTAVQHAHIEKTVSAPVAVLCRPGSSEIRQNTERIIYCRHPSRGIEHARAKSKSLRLEWLILATSEMLASGGQDEVLMGDRGL